MSKLAKSPDIDLLKDQKFKHFVDTVSNHEKAISHLTLPEQRQLNADFILKYNNSHESIYRTENLTISGLENHPIPIRVYIPYDSSHLPVVMYFHGGGWVFGGIDEADAVCRRLANHLGCIIASVGYRLAPEFPFPKPLEDCYAATKWMAQNAHLFGGDKSRIMVSGESAGGNLAGAVALMARDKQEPKLAAQLLLYPVISSCVQDEAYDNCPDQFFLTKDDMKFFWSMYTPNPGEDKNPYASLNLCTKFHDLPPALIITAEYDPLSFEGKAYTNQLQQAGVKVIHKSFSKLIHGFLYIPLLYDESQKVQWTKEIRSSLHDLGVF